MNRDGPRRLLKWALLVPAGLLALALAAALTVLLLPGLVLNEPVLRQASRWVSQGGTGARVEWGTLAVDWEVSRFLGRHIRIDFEDLRLDLPGMGGSFQRRGSLALGYDLRRIVPRLRELGPVRLSGGHTALRLARGAGETGQEDRSARGAFGLPAWLRAAAVREILIDEQSWTVATGDLAFSGTALAHVLPEEDGGLGVIAFATHRLAAGPLRHDGEIRLAAVGGRGAPWMITVEGAVEGAGIGRGRTGLTAELDGREVQWRLVADWRHAQGWAHATAQGEWDGALRAVIDAEASPARAPEALGRPVVRLDGCRLEWLPDARAARQSLTADCPVAVSAPAPGGRERLLLAARVGGAFEAALPFDARAPVASRIEIRPRTVWLARAEGHARASASIVPAQPDRPSDLALDIDVRAEMPGFQQLVAALADTAYAVPAPFHTLQGPISASVRGRGGPPDVELAAELATRLRSGHQRLDADLSARLRPRGDWPEAGPLRLALTADLLLKDVVLRLPPLGPGAALPAVVPDARIQPRLEEAETEGGGPGALDYAVRVRTEAGHAIEISAPVSGEMIPLAADVTLGSGRPLSGRIGIGEFPLEVAGFEREVEGGELFLRLSDVKEEAAGELAFDAQGRTIDLSLAEMTGRFTPLPEPKPPLALGQIVASLLTGRAVDVAVVSGGTLGRPDAEPREAPTSLEFQYRY